MNKQILKAVVYGGLFLIPFVPLLVSGSLFFPFITTKAFAWRFIVEIVFATWIILALLDKAYRPQKSPILYALGIFIAIIGLADIVGVAPMKSFWSNFERMEGFVSLLHVGAFFLVISSTFREIEWKRWWNTSLVASGLITLIALREVFMLGEWRVDATFGNASYLAVYLLFHIFISLMFAYRNSDKRILWAYVTLAIVQVVALYYTATRGAILGLLGGALAVAVLNLFNKESRVLRRTGVVTLSLIVLLIGSFWFSRHSAFVTNSPVLSRFTAITTEELQSGGRSFVWPMALEGIKERPLLGWGQENFSEVFSKYYDPEMYRLEPWFDRAHNIFLDWGVAGGILGLLSYLSLYIVFIYLVWRGRGDFSYTEKTLLSGLLLAYFFHNLFVFDHLVSYILFFALLAYVHTRVASPHLSDVDISVHPNHPTISSVVLILGILVMYFVNLHPLSTNLSILGGLRGVTEGRLEEAAQHFQGAVDGSTLGRQEAVEQAVTYSSSILSNNISSEKKNEYFQVLNTGVRELADDLPRDARTQIFAGMFLSNTGFPTEGLEYLSRAHEISPKKQSILFEIGALHMNQGNTREGMQALQEAYELAPDYQEAKIIYLLGAIYTGDRALESKLKNELPQEVWESDPRIQNARNRN